MKNEKAKNLKLGAIYINATTGLPNRLTHIVPCEGVWLEDYDGTGYGETTSFDNVLYADLDEVQDFLEDSETYNRVTSRDAYDGKPIELPKPPKAIYIPNV